MQWSESPDAAPEPVPIAHFDFDSLDSLEAHAREALDRGESLGPLLKSWLRREECDLKLEGLRTVLAEVLSSRRPEVAAWQLAFVGGLDVTLGLSGPEIARELGISKQAFFQGVEGYRSRFQGLRILNMRDAKARENMRQRGYRKPSV